MKIMRHQQEPAIQSIFDYFNNGGKGNPLVVAPVGAGKSLMIAEFMRRACTMYPGTKIMVLAHVSELLTQTAAELYEQWPEAHVSFYAAKLKKRDLSGEIIFASIQSVFGRAYDLTKGIDLVIVDEAHLISLKQNTIYQKFFADLRIVNPHLKIIGFTGTPFRATEGNLVEGDGRTFTDIVYQIPMLYLIEKGFLCPPITPTMKTKMSTDGVGRRNGDFIEAQLQKAVDKDPITKGCVDEIIEYGQDRKKWIVFTVGVDHCGHVRDEIRSRGISCEMVHGGTSDGERSSIINRYIHGDLRCLVNIGCFTTGFNNPAIDLLAIMRPTRSPVLYVQMAGRAVRTYPGKENALILDFGGVVEALGPLDLVDVKKAYKGTGDAPVKICPKCDAVCFASVRFCPDCNFAFEFKDPFKEMVARAATNPILSTQIEPTWHNVTGMYQKKHVNPAKPLPTMKVTYYCMEGRFSEWLGFEHPGRFGGKARAWHTQRSSMPMPRTVDEAVANEYPQPSRILVKEVKGHLPEILDYDFDAPRSGALETSTNEPVAGPPIVVELEEYEIPW